MQIMNEFPPEQLEACLMQLMAPDTNVIKQAENTLKMYVKHVQCVGGFMQQISASAHPQVRQMAATLLKKKINNHWSKLNQTTQAEIKQLLLQRCVQEDNRLVRKGLCNLVAAVAKHQLPSQQWNELLIFISECAKSINEDHREVAMLLFYCLTETTGESLEHHFQQIKLMFLNALKDAQSVKVRFMAMKAACSLLEFLSSGEGVIQFQELVPSMIEVLRLCIAQGDESEATEFMDIFGDIAESSVQVLTPSLQPLIHFLLQTMMNDELEISTRDSASLVINTLIEGKAKAIGKAKLVPDIVHALLQVVARDDSSAGGMLSNQFLDEEDDDDEDESTPTQIAQRTLDVLALSMPAKYLDGCIMGAISECLNAADPAGRKAGVVALAVIAEGCADRLRDKLDDILPFLYRSAEESNALLREGACFALGQFSEHLQPEILEHYENLLPIVFKLLDDATPSVKGTSCYVLECFTENMDAEAVLPYLEPLMTKLAVLVQTSKPQVQLMAISAIGSTAVGAEEAFQTYFPTIANMICPFLQVADEKLFSLRGRALECMGYMAIAVGKETFQPYFADSMQFAIASTQLDDMELCDYSFAFFCNVSKVMEEDFAPYLQQIVEIIGSVIKMDDGMKVSVRGGEEDNVISFADSDDDEEEGDEDDSNGRAVVSVRTAMLDMKASAVGAIEAIAENTGACFEAYIPICIQILSNVTDYFHESVRSNAIASLCQLIIVSLKARPMTSDWVKGRPDAVSIDKSTMSILDALVVTCKDFLEDMDSSVVEKTLIGLTKISEEMGPLATVSLMESLMECVHQILTDSHVCQGEEDDDEEEDEEVGSLLEAACNLIVSQAKAYGKEFEPLFHQLIPHLKKYMKGVRPPTDRSTVFGCIAEVCQEMEQISGNIVTDLLPLVIKGLADEDANVRQNCAFLAGILAQVGGPSLHPHYQSLLQGLRPLFELEDEANQGIVDNACAAVARLIMANPQGIPLDHVLPVLVQALPLKCDFTENETVYSCLIGLIHQQMPAAMNMIPTIVKIFAEVLVVDGDVEEEVQQEIVACLRGLVENFRDQMTQVMQGLPAELQSRVSFRLQ